MDPARFTRVDSTTWRAEPSGKMHVGDHLRWRKPDPGYGGQGFRTGSERSKAARDRAGHLCHAGRTLGYGFAIGGVAAFDPDRGGVISAGGVGFDISCGVRTMLTGLSVADILPIQKQLADSLFRQIPAGVGSESAITLDAAEMEAMLSQGAHWAVAWGWGETRDLERIEEQGRMAGARSDCVSDRAMERHVGKWGRLARAITISRSRRWPRFLTRPSLMPSGSCRTKLSSPFTVVRAASATKSEPSS